MSDWNTLHLFDSKRFYNTVVPEMKNGGELVDFYFKSKLYSLKNRFNELKNDDLRKLKLFLSDFNGEFKHNQSLHNIENRQKKEGQDYKEFIREKYNDEEEFRKEYSNEIYHYTSLLPLIIFSECAQFNPHLILGRRIFESNISVKKNSIAEECYNKINNGGIYSDTGYVMDWINYEDIKLLWLDIENIYPVKDETEQYFNDFKKFVEIAVKNSLGLISISNVNEPILKMIDNPYLNIEIDIQKMNFKSVINYE